MCITTIGVIADIVLAVVTVISTALALYLAITERIKRVDAIFIWETDSDLEPTLLVQNNCNQTILIDSIKVYYARSLVKETKSSENEILRKISLLKPKSEAKIGLDISLKDICEPKNEQQKYELKIIIYPKFGRRKITRQKYSYEELTTLFFGRGFMKGLKSN